jgi:type IV pilus assembly protein PilV
MNRHPRLFHPRFSHPRPYRLSGTRRTFGTPRQQGFTLLEVLIAMAVMGVGLFGLAAVQLIALRTNTSAYQRSLASVLAADMMDRIRTNVHASVVPSDDADAYVYSGGTPPARPAQCDVDFACPSSDPSCDAECTAERLRDWDLNFWLTETDMLGQLPNAVARISRAPIERTLDGTDTVIAYRYTIQIDWDDFQRTSENQTDTTSFTYSSIISRP